MCRRGVGSTESREWRGKWSCSWPEDDDDDESEKQDDARESDASGSELSWRNSTTARFNTATLDAWPPFRYRSSKCSDLATEELEDLDGVTAVAVGHGDGDVDAATVIFCCVCTFISRSRSLHLLEHVSALGEKTYGSTTTPAVAVGFLSFLHHRCLPVSPFAPLPPPPPASPFPSTHGSRWDGASKVQGVADQGGAWPASLNRRGSRQSVASELAAARIDKLRGSCKPA
ncbi:hypothetical protein E2562_038881 [Oryza meyeriana var. granulata]|uniref:Uncharacterized protein n=1 Tax=Oryza meyeriana var. granulata TaxID=110450 RepID=A0A6G1CLF2_9ORYZ|nr:hypothetical protein E2562_038881 [Oryza meyeriana var. granulata]